MKPIRLLFFCALTVAVYFDWTLYVRLSARERKISELSAQVQKLQARLKKALALDESARQAEAAQIAELTRQRDAESAVLEQLKGDLAAGENRGFDRGFRHSAEDARAKHVAALQDAQADLAQIQSEEKDIAANAKQAKASSDWSEHAQKDDAARKQQALEAQIKSEQSQLAELKRQKFNYDDQQKIPELQATLTQDQATLQQMKADRAGAGASWGQNRQAIEGQRLTALSDARSREQAARTRVQAEKAEIQKIDQSLGSDSRSEKEKRAQLDQLRGAIHGHQAALADLEARIRQEQAKLQVLDAQVQE